MSVIGSQLQDEVSNSNSENLKSLKKKYSVIPQEIREKFIKRVISHEVTIKEAAKEFGIKFSTSKAILQTFKREGRIGKKKSRQRKPRIQKKILISSISTDKQITKQKIVPVILYKTNNSISKIRQEPLLTPIIPQHQQQQNSSPTFQQLQQSDIFDPEMKSTLLEMQNTLQQNQRPLQFYNNNNKQEKPANYQLQHPQPQYHRYNYQKQDSLIIYNNPFVTSPPIPIQNKLKEEFYDIEDIKQQIDELDEDKIKNQAVQFMNMQEEYQKQSEFNYYQYFD